MFLMQGGLQGNTGGVSTKQTSGQVYSSSKKQTARRGFLGKQIVTVFVTTYFCLFTLTHELHYLLYKQAMGMVSHGELFSFFIIKSYFLKITPAQ